MGEEGNNDEDKEGKRTKVMEKGKGIMNKNGHWEDGFRRLPIRRD